MKHKVNTILAVSFAMVLLVLSGCSSSRVLTRVDKKMPVLKYSERVVVFSIEQPKPDDAIFVGKVKVNGVSDFNNDCNYDMVIERIKSEARKMGGNLVKITNHKGPNKIRSCHKIKADIYKVDDVNQSVR